MADNISVQWSTTCPSCGALPGERCNGWSRAAGIGFLRPGTVHGERIQVFEAGQIQENRDMRWEDRQHDVWSFEEDGLLHSFETSPFEPEYVDKKWGPLRLVRGNEKVVGGIVITDGSKPTKADEFTRHIQAAALQDAADAIQALHPGEIKNSVVFLRERAKKILAGDI